MNYYKKLMDFINSESVAKQADYFTDQIRITKENLYKLKFETLFVNTALSEENLKYRLKKFNNDVSKSDELKEMAKKVVALRDHVNLSDRKRMETNQIQKISRSQEMRQFIKRWEKDNSKISSNKNAIIKEFATDLVEIISKVMSIDVLADRSDYYYLLLDLLDEEYDLIGLIFEKYYRTESKNRLKIEKQVIGQTIFKILMKIHLLDFRGNNNISTEYLYELIFEADELTMNQIDEIENVFCPELESRFSYITDYGELYPYLMTDTEDLAEASGPIVQKNDIVENPAEFLEECTSKLKPHKPDEDLDLILSEVKAEVKNSGVTELLADKIREYTSRIVDESGTRIEELEKVDLSDQSIDLNLDLLMDRYLQLGTTVSKNSLFEGVGHRFLDDDFLRKIDSFYLKYRQYYEAPVMYKIYTLQKMGIIDQSEFEKELPVFQLTWLKTGDKKVLTNMKNGVNDANEGFVDFLTVLNFLLRLSVDLIYKDRFSREVDWDLLNDINQFYEANYSNLEHDIKYNYQAYIEDQLTISLNYLTISEADFYHQILVIFSCGLTSKQKRSLKRIIVRALDPNRTGSLESYEKRYIDKYRKPDQYLYAPEFLHKSALLFLAEFILEPYYLAVTSPYYLFYHNIGYDLPEQFDSLLEFGIGNEKELEQKKNMKLDSEILQLLNTPDLTFNNTIEVPELSPLFSIIRNWDAVSGTGAFLTLLSGHAPRYRFIGMENEINHFNKFMNDSSTKPYWEKTPDVIKYGVLNFLAEKIDNRKRMIKMSEKKVESSQELEMQLSKLSMENEDLKAALETINNSIKKNNGNDEKLVEEIRSAFQKGQKTASDQYLKEIRILKEEISKLNDKINDQKNEKQELIKLREQLFTESVEEEKKEIIAPLISSQEKEQIQQFFFDYDVVFAGGHERLVRQLKEKYRNIRFFSTVNDSENLITNADLILFFPKFMSHTLYYKVINVAHRCDIQIDYLNFKNLDVTEKELLKIIKRIKKDRL